jgi:hypothetical protein
VQVDNADSWHGCGRYYYAGVGNADSWLGCGRYYAGVLNADGWLAALVYVKLGTADARTKQLIPALIVVPILVN